MHTLITRSVVNSVVFHGYVAVVVVVVETGGCTFGYVLSCSISIGNSVTECGVTSVTSCVIMSTGGTRWSSIVG